MTRCDDAGLHQGPCAVVLCVTCGMHWGLVAKAEICLTIVFRRKQKTFLNFKL